MAYVRDSLRGIGRSERLTVKRTMAILELFSTRRKKERGEVPDVFVYDELPKELRIQVIFILHDALGQSTSEHGFATEVYKVYVEILEQLSRHFGRQKLADGDVPEQILANFLLREANVEHWLDAVELSCRMMEAVGYGWDYKQTALAKLTPDEAIADLNHRFLQHGVGYQYVSGKIIRCDSQFLHAQVVRPTLALLQDKRYRGANDEFLKAHEHYRKGEVKDCLTDSLSALESTLKTICKIRGWKSQPKDTAKPLLDICFSNGLIPAFLRSHYSALQSTLESGVPTLRNKLGGHGQGVEVVSVPPHYAAYALHLTASAIQFLIEAEKNLP
jgi:Domain of unknown function (DUF7014)/AbiJ N-terminal domain 4